MAVQIDTMEDDDASFDIDSLSAMKREMGPAMFLINNDGIIIGSSINLDRITGIPFEDLTGASLISMTVPEDQKRVLRSIGSVFENGIPTSLDIDLFSLDRGTHPVNAALLPYPSDDGSRTVYCVMTSKVLLMDMENQRDEANRLKLVSENFLTDFVALTTREIRQPLTTLLLNLEMMEGGMYGDVTKDQKVKYGQMIDLVDRLKDLLNDAIETTSALSDECCVEMETLDLYQVVKDAIGLWGEDLGERSIHVALDASELQDWRVTGERRSLMQAVSSLIRGSMDMSPDSGTIVISMARSGDHVQASISDTGDGLSRSDADVLFDRFGDTDSLGRISQVMGLYMAKRIIEKHHGTVWCESYIGLGSTLIMRIPVPGTRS